MTAATASIQRSSSTSLPTPYPPLHTPTHPYPFLPAPLPPDPPPVRLGRDRGGPRREAALCSVARRGHQHRNQAGARATHSSTHHPPTHLLKAEERSVGSRFRPRSAPSALPRKWHSFLSVRASGAASLLASLTGPARACVSPGEATEPAAVRECARARHGRLSSRGRELRRRRTVSAAVSRRLRRSLRLVVPAAAGVDVHSGTGAGPRAGACGVFARGFSACGCAACGRGIRARGAVRPGAISVAAA